MVIGMTKCKGGEKESASCRQQGHGREKHDEVPRPFAFMGQIRGLHCRVSQSNSLIVTDANKNVLEREVSLKN